MPQPPSYTLYSPQGSFRAFAPLIAAEYNGVDIKVVTDNIEEIVQTKSPTGKAPILECPSGDIIFSSHSMARYVAGIRRDTGLLGTNGQQSHRIAIDSWMDWIAQDVELPACIVFYPIAGFMAENKAATSKALKDLGSALQKVDGSLKDKTYLVGNSITLADIILACTLLYPFKLVCDKSRFLKPYPNVVRWYEHCVSQSEFQAVVGKVEICETSSIDMKETTTEDAKGETQQQAAEQDEDGGSGGERRMVAIAVTPKAGIDPQAMYEKIKTEITSQPQYKLKWDDDCKVEGGKIYASFTIALEADFDEEVMEWIEMMEDDVQNQEVTFQSAME